MTHSLLKEVCEDISKRPRFINSYGASYTKSLIEDFTTKNNISLTKEAFKTKLLQTNLFLKARKIINLNILNEFKEHVEGKLILLEIEKIRYINTLDEYIPLLLINDIIDIELYKDKLNKLKPKAILFSLVNMDINFYQRIFGFSMPIFSIGYKDIESIQDIHYISLEPLKEDYAMGENLFFDIGRGPIVYILSSLSSKEDSNGAIYSASSVALSLSLAESFCKSYNSYFKFRFFFTEDTADPFEGIYKHLEKNPKYAYYAISFFNVGWANKSLFYEDAHGENAIYTGDKFYKYVKSLNQNIYFLKSKTVSSLHAPFKTKDISTLMLGSYPCIISNTVYDDIESVRLEELQSWFEILSGFLRKLHAL